MKSATFATALLAAVAVAQPHHGHARRHNHAKRDLVVEWTTEWVTETVWVDDDVATSTAAPTTTAAPAAKPTTSQAPAAQFFEPLTQAKPSVSEVKPTAEAVKPVEPSPEQPAPAPVTTSPPAPVVAPTTLIPAPKPTTVAPPPPPPSPTVVAPPPPAQSTAQQAPVQAPSAPSSGGAEKFTGDITYYQPGMGSCGYDDSNPKGNVVAVSKDWFMKVGQGKTSYGVDQPANILCDKTITISAKGKTTQATIRDSCPGCAPGSIDVTEGAFTDLFGSLDIGRGEVTWWLNEPVTGA